MPLSSTIPFVPSPNFSKRRTTTAPGILATVIHYTAGGAAAGSIKWLCNPSAKASAHFLISRSGIKTQLVEIENKAWHAGRSEMLLPNGEMISDPNSHTIGIELANYGLLTQREGGFFYRMGGRYKRYRRDAPVEASLTYDNGKEAWGFWEPYAREQMDGLRELLKMIGDAGYPEAAANLVGHEEIGMPLGRKSDPGALFDWKSFGRDGPRRTSSSLYP